MNIQHPCSIMSRITMSARGEECTMNLPGVCNYNPDTVVFAHSNRSIDGKGMGLKAKDQNGAYLCFSCHSCYDRQSKRPANLSLEEVESRFSIAMKVTQYVLIQKGLISFEVTSLYQQF